MAIKIKELSTTGGFLEKATIQFADGLNCIIGSRGTCKSTVVETIRFLFDTDKDKIKEMVDPEKSDQSDGVSHRGLIAATLGGATARCKVLDIGTETQTLTIERDIGTESRIYRDGIKQLTDQDLLRRVEIYSQGELQRIAENSHRRLELIDRPNQKKISELKADRAILAEKLKLTGNEIRIRRTAIEARRVELKSFDAFQQTLSQLQESRPNLSPELDVERTRYNQRQSVLIGASNLVTKWNQLTEHLLPLARSADEFRAIATSLKQLDIPEANALGNLFASIAEFATKTKTEADHVTNTLPLYSTTLAQTFDKLNEKYIQLRKGQEDLNDALRREDHVRQQINHLERIRDDANKLSGELNVLIEQRANLRKYIARSNDDVFNLRAAEVEKINEIYHEKVLLTLAQSSHAGSYRQTLSRLLDKSRLRNQDEIAAQIANQIPPHELVDIVESGDSQRLATVLDRDLGQMARLVGFLIDNAGLYDVETEIFEDVLDITLFDNGTPKRVDQLSNGQKATAMLPLILREAEYPLIFDQPEDDLDNRFIYETLVERIRDLKSKRQLIFVTHNANIPVLGEADQVVVMTMENPNRSGAPEVGSIDSVKDKILSLLEGGADAFRMRQVKYGSLLN